MAVIHYDHQVRMAKEHVIPLLETETGLCTGMKVLEVGCAESGVLRALKDINIDAIGMELLEGRIKAAKEINPDLEIYQGDITDDGVLKMFNYKFDLIIIRDVIEHIPDQEKAFQIMHQLLKDKGYIYITFPPLYSPYAGHQQGANGPLKAFLWVHLFPAPVIRILGKLFKTRQSKIDEIIQNAEIGLTISRFTNIYKRTGFEAVRKDLFLSRPVFKVRWNWPVIKFPHVPILKELLATGCEYLLRKS